jgi:uncharacterized protein (DUF983 family)
MIAPRCPACGNGKLFKDVLSVVDECSACGLVLKHHDAADGPIFFAITIVGFLVMGLAAYVEFHYSPPLWLHALLWIPFTIIACLVILRVFKAWMITIEHRLAILRGNTSDD